MDLVDKVTSLLFNILSRLVMTAITICSDFGAQKNKVSHCFHCFPIYFPWSDGTGCHHLSFLNTEFQSAVFTCLFTIIKRLFSSSSLSAIRGVSSAYLSSLMFFLLILISPCLNSHLSGPAFLRICSVYRLNKQDDSRQPGGTPFYMLQVSYHM